MIGRTLTYLPACAIVPAFSPKTRATPASPEPPRGIAQKRIPVTQELQGLRGLRSFRISAALFEHTLRLVGETS